MIGDILGTNLFQSKNISFTLLEPDRSNLASYPCDSKNDKFSLNLKGGGFSFFVIRDLSIFRVVIRDLSPFHAVIRENLR